MYRFCARIRGMLGTTKVQDAKPGSATRLLGRPSSDRAEWEAAREADAADLNRFQEAGGEIAAYVVPLWSNGDAVRCLQELRGFDEVRVAVVPARGEDAESALAAVAESGWAGAAFLGSPLPSSGEEEVGGEGLAELARFIHAAAGLEIPVLLPDLDPALAHRALARALGEELTPREIEAVLRGDDPQAPDADALAWADDLLGGETA